MRCLLLLLALSAGLSANAAERTIRGMGLLNCKAYVDTRHKRLAADELEYSSWMTGFLSGYVAFRDTEQAAHFTVPPPATLLSFVDGHCQRFPNATVAEALNAMIARSLLARMNELTSTQVSTK
jgi:hypothetical protein